MDLLPNGGRIAGGSIKLAGREITGLTPPEIRKIRGDEIGMIFQDPLSSLNPTHTVGTADRRGRAAAPGGVQEGRPRARHRGARPGRHAAGAGAGGRVPAPVLRRHAPARDDRDGAGLRSQAAHRRRADDRAGRDHPEADPRAHRRPAAAARHGGHHGHPRPRRDRRAGGPGRGHVRGQGRGDDRHPGAVRQPAPPVHRGAVPRAAGEVGRDPGAAVLHSRRPAGPGQPARGLPLRAALPVRHRPVPDRAPGARGGDDRARLPLLLPGRRAGEDRRRPARDHRARAAAGGRGARRRPSSATSCSRPRTWSRTSR